MFENFVIFFVLIALGALFARLRPGGVRARHARDVINSIVLNFSVPAMCFKVIATTNLDRNVILVPLSAVAAALTALFVAFCVYTFIGRFVRISKADKGVLIVVSAFGNLMTLGIPILTGLYGQETMRHIFTFDLMGSNPLLWIGGTTILAYYSSGGKITLKEAMKKLVSLPPIWGLFAGLCVNIAGLELPNFVLIVCDMLATPVVPMMLLAIGLSLTVPKIDLVLIGFPSVLIKLLIMPLAAFVYALTFGISDPIALKSVVLESAMPVMASAVMIVSIYKIEQTLAAFMTVFSMILSFITIPVIAWLLQRFGY